MIRTIVRPTENNLTINLPDNLVGKMVEVLAFEVEASNNTTSTDVEKRIKALEKGLNKYRADLSDFKFDRNEANDYD